MFAFGNFDPVSWGWGFEKCDLRVWNSVHARGGTPTLQVGVGDGWGSGIAEMTFAKPPIWILKVLISNSVSQQRGKVSPFNPLRR